MSDSRPLGGRSVWPHLKCNPGKGEKRIVGGSIPARPVEICTGTVEPGVMDKLEAEFHVEPGPERRTEIIERDIVELEGPTAGIRTVVCRDGTVEQRVAATLDIEIIDRKPDRLLVVISALDQQAVQINVRVRRETERLAGRQVLIFSDVAGLQ